MKLVLVRHGFSQGNLEKTYSGFTDVELTQDGIDELKRFKDEYHYPETDRYISSSLVRCRDTFEILFGDTKELDLVSDELRELYFGDYENQKSEDMVPHYFEGFALNERTAKGETMTEFTYRILSKLERILADLKKNNEDSATIVCHSGVIKAILLFLGSKPFSAFSEIETRNGLGYVLDVDFDDVRCSIKLNSYTAIGLK